MYKKRWQPNASQRSEFAIRMQDPEEKEAYEQRKRDREQKRLDSSQFDYNKAGGEYIPTLAQHNFCLNRPVDLTSEQDNACNLVASAYFMQEKIHHDYIHIVNELIRKNYQL